MILRLALITLALASPAGAFDLDGFKLAWPADCIPGDTCHIQHYPDHDPGPLASDFTCGPLSYDGHDGTDIALPNRAAMAAGVAVLAAAPGVVRGVRDGVADFAPKVEGRECGNGVLVEHQGGWVTQYCHMRQGSVIVKPGQSVETGTPLGLIGQSGMADFPHVHLSLRHNDTQVDPFAPDTATCALTQGPTLWATPVAYEPGGFLAAGFADSVPDFDTIKGGLDTTPLPATAPGIVLWAHAFGSRAGDLVTFQITGPDGAFLSEDVTLEKTQAQMFRAMGKRLTAAAWPPGPYHGTVTLTRDGNRIDQITTMVTVGP